MIEPFVAAICANETSKEPRRSRHPCRHAGHGREPIEWASHQPCDRRVGGTGMPNGDA